MPVSEDFLEYIKDQLRDTGKITIKKMFGGAGIYVDSIITGLVADDVLYLKVSDSNMKDYESAGMKPFRPYEDKPHAMSYWEVPPDVMENENELKIWVEKAREASLQKPGKKKTK